MNEMPKTAAELPRNLDLTDDLVRRLPPSVGKVSRTIGDAGTTNLHLRLGHLSAKGRVGAHSWWVFCEMAPTLQASTPNTSTSDRGPGSETDPDAAPTIKKRRNRLGVRLGEWPAISVEEARRLVPVVIELARRGIDPRTNRGLWAPDLAGSQPVPQQANGSGSALNDLIREHATAPLLADPLEPARIRAGRQSAIASEIASRELLPA